MAEITTCEYCGTCNWRMVGDENKHLATIQEAHTQNAKPRQAFYCAYCWQKNNLWVEILGN
ncbi:MAG: hypothetical protein Unbinned2404contig1000_7 [Prokaryotic dsDNA virus sp.]|nr:MAG: hypothetical protein Unbinned2404contig1000_7 [Prokaryotic dsDNA virus sp.]